jgi:hypothetical protein
MADQIRDAVHAIRLAAPMRQTDPCPVEITNRPASARPHKPSRSRPTSLFTAYPNPHDMPCQACPSHSFATTQALPSAIRLALVTPAHAMPTHADMSIPAQPSRATSQAIPGRCDSPPHHRPCPGRFDDPRPSRASTTSQPLPSRPFATSHIRPTHAVATFRAKPSARLSLTILTTGRLSTTSHPAPVRQAPSPLALPVLPANAPNLTDMPSQLVSFRSLPTNPALAIHTSPRLAMPFVDQQSDGGGGDVDR